MIACGAWSAPIADICTRRGWPVAIHPLNPLLHNSPERIAGEVERLVEDLAPTYERVVIGYADCGTYGALDTVCERLGLERLPGLHCYGVYAGAEAIDKMLDDEPGTYLLTDFLVRSFRRTVVRELGLDRWPELRDDYFRHYSKAVWLVQTEDPAELRELHRLAREAAKILGLPLLVRRTGVASLERALADLIGASACPSDTASLATCSSDDQLAKAISSHNATLRPAADF